MQSTLFCLESKTDDVQQVVRWWTVWLRVSQLCQRCCQIWMAVMIQLTEQKTTEQLMVNISCFYTLEVCTDREI